MENKEKPSANEECPVWSKLRSGDRMALAAIFNEHYDSLYYYGKKLVRNDDMVKDCIQNLFLKVWTTRHKLMAVTCVRPYLLKSFRRHITDQMIAENRKNILHEHFDGDFVISFSHEDTLIALQTSDEQREALARSLNNLAARQREAIFLRFYQNLDYIRIAEVMALNVQSVRNLIYQSLKTIKVELSPSTTLVRVESTRR